MCDTLVALPDFTRDGSVLFAKNSDREPDESHVVVRIPERQYLPKETLHTTYLEIPQMRQTYEVLLFKPFWIWGSEMGVNQWGVVIGNEALFEKKRVEKKPGLLGMDLIRLALERSISAAEAVQVITDLLEKYGQGGSSGYRHKAFAYHNAFLIADFKEAFVLETLNREWVVKKISSGRYAISNCISVREDYDRASAGLREKKRLDFKRKYEGFLFTYFSGARKRRTRALELLDARRGQLTPRKMAAILRDHGEKAAGRHPAELSNGSLCMHAADPLIRQSQTVGSFIVELKSDGRILPFATGTSAPCLSVFKPVFLGCPTHWRAESTFDPNSLWWRHEQLHREFLKRPARVFSDFQNERNELETYIWQEAEYLSREPAEIRCRGAQEIYERSLTFELSWLKKLSFVPTKPRFFYSRFWEKMSERNGVPEVVPQNYTPSAIFSQE